MTYIYILDDFYFNHLDVEKYKELSLVLKIILVRSHCEAVIEWRAWEDWLSGLRHYTKN